MVNVLLVFFYYWHWAFNEKSGYLIISESKQDKWKKQEDTCLLGYRYRSSAAFTKKKKYEIKTNKSF